MSRVSGCVRTARALRRRPSLPLAPSGGRATPADAFVLAGPSSRGGESQVQPLHQGLTERTNPEVRGEKRLTACGGAFG